MSGQLEFEEEDRSVILRRAWELSLHLLATKINEVTFNSYVRTIQPLSYAGETVTLGVSSAFAREWLENKWANAIRSALEFHLNTGNIQIKFVVLTREQARSAEAGASARKAESAARNVNEAQPTLPLDEETENPGPAPKPSIRKQSPVPPPTPGRSTAARKAAPKPEEELPLPSLPLNDRYLFETFLVGRSNRLAHAGAMQVAAKPGEVYNPLFLYGGPGLGKTHLLQGIAHTLRKAQPGIRIAYVSGEYFAQHYISALQYHATENFRRQYRQVDVWLVDDIQFIAGKEHTKEEFFHTFNSLYQSGRQIVFASDRSPRELNTMDERLRSRFQSGLIADIGAPELETRIAILQQCCLREAVAVSADVLHYIAGAIQSNIRALEGALTKLIAYSSIMNIAISPELAQSVLGEYFIEKPIQYRRLTVDEIVETVARQFETKATEIKGPSRNKDLALARHIAMYLCRELLPGENIRIVGAAFGGRDHTTIVKACQKLRAAMDVDRDLEAMVRQFRKELSG